MSLLLSFSSAVILRTLRIPVYIFELLLIPSFLLYSFWTTLILFFKLPQLRSLLRLICEFKAKDDDESGWTLEKKLGMFEGSWFYFYCSARLDFLSFSPALFNHCFKIEVSTGKNFLFSVWSIVYSLIIFELLHLTSL